MGVNLSLIGWVLALALLVVCWHYRRKIRKREAAIRRLRNRYAIGTPASTDHPENQEAE